MVRCKWCSQDPEYIAYHDNQWGVETHGDEKLFEILTLEGAQAGLNWLTILKRRDGYKKAFLNFEIEKVAKLSFEDVERLMGDERIIRNRLKIKSTVNNARVIAKLKGSSQSFDNLIWAYQAKLKALSRPEVAKLMSKDLKNLGFSFVGPTICYAFMQAIGIVDDHEEECFKFSGAG